MIRRIKRRNFLAGAGGLLVALPFLEGLSSSRKARAAEEDQRYFLFFRQWFGVAQKPRWSNGDVNEIETFWPDADVQAGGAAVPLSKELLQRTPGGQMRALGELADYANSLLVLRGVRLMDLEGLHRQPLVQVLSGSYYQKTRPDFDPGDANNAWPIHETIDTLIARTLNGAVPLTFESCITNTMTSFSNGANPGDNPILNPAMQQPSSAYRTLFAQATEDANQLARRQYASDAVVEELKSLKNDPRLSSADRRRLDQHFDGLNAVEASLACIPPGLDDPSFASILAADAPKSNDPSKQRWQAIGNFNEYSEVVADAFIKIAALGVSCGAYRVANIVMSGPTNFDHTDIFTPGTPEYEQGFPGHYHSISHRSFTDTSDNDPSQSGAAMRAHQAIDRWHARQFGKLLGQLDEYGILDKGICLWSNEISCVDHAMFDMPYVIAGSASGALKVGQYLDLQNGPTNPGDIGDATTTRNNIMNKQMPCSKVLNTIGAALGVKSADGTPLADYAGHQKDASGNVIQRALGNLPDLLA